MQYPSNERGCLLKWPINGPSGAAAMKVLPVAACLLVIGSRALADTVREAVPNSDVVVVDHALEGLWQAGRGQFDSVVIALPANERTSRTVQGIRQVAPRSRLVYVCPATTEPQARDLLGQGLDDYVLSPVRSEDLRRALNIVDPAPAEPLTAVKPAPEELLRFSEILRDLGSGPRKTLASLAELIATTFSASAVRVQIDDLYGEVGTMDAPVLEEPITRGDRVIGRISLSRRMSGSYGTSAAAWLSKYAVLADAAVQSARGQQHWQRLAWTDDLSELGNRRYFEKRTAELLERAAQNRERMTVFLFDLDDFKSYNDNYGQEAGDALIREFAELLSRSTRSTDVVARYGGDEFAILFWDAEPPRAPGSHHPDDALALGERFARTIAEHAFECLGPAAPGPVTISGGVACYPWDGGNVEQLLKAADESLLAAKRSDKHIQIAAGLLGRQPPA
jgi:diguanylate cyclase (GGDEF)-like protein